MSTRRFKLIKGGLSDGTVLSDLNDVAATAPVNGDVLTWNGTTWLPLEPVDYRQLGAHWGSTVALVAAEMPDIVVYFDRATVIQSVTIIGDAAGSAILDIWKKARTSLPAVNADSITAAANPTVTAARSSRDTTLTGWTKNVAAGDTLTFHVDSCSTFTQLTILLDCLGD